MNLGKAIVLSAITAGLVAGILTYIVNIVGVHNTYVRYFLYYFLYLYL